MAMNVTRLQMRARARQRANMESSSFVTDDEVNDLINVYLCEFYDWLVDAGFPAYFQSETTISTVSGTLAYALPADFRSLVGVYANESATRRRELGEMFPGHEAAYDAPSGAYAVTLRYVPTPPQLTSDDPDATGQIDDVSGWSQLIIKAVARDMLAKEESDVMAVTSELAEVKGRILTQASKRYQGGPRYINDVEESLATRSWSNTGVDAWRLAGGNIYLYRSGETWP